MSFDTKGGLRTFAALSTKDCNTGPNRHWPTRDQLQFLIGSLRDEKYLEPEPNIFIITEKPTTKRPKNSSVLSGIVRKA